MHRVVALVGHSGSGKSELTKLVCERVPQLAEVMSFTTRPPTGDEGRDRMYRFYEAANVAQLAQHREILNVINYDGYAYGNIWDDLNVVTDANQIGILALTEDGVQNFRAHPNIDLFIVEVTALGAPIRPGREDSDRQRRPLAYYNLRLVNNFQIGGLEVAADKLIGHIKRRFRLV